nr:MAG TPA: putative membrane protein [Caudoviricetes sp.]
MHNAQYAQNLSFNFYAIPVCHRCAAVLPPVHWLC